MIRLGNGKRVSSFATLAGLAVASIAMAEWKPAKGPLSTRWTNKVTPDNALPVDLRRDLLSLSAFVDRRTFDVMASPSPEKLSALIDINRHIASGLTGTPA